MRSGKKSRVVVFLERKPRRGLSLRSTPIAKLLYQRWPERGQRERRPEMNKESAPLGIGSRSPEILID
jgi:hypothetical protein